LLLVDFGGGDFEDETDGDFIGDDFDIAFAAAVGLRPASRSFSLNVSIVIMISFLS